MAVMRGARRERRLQRAGARPRACNGATSRWSARSRASCARCASPIRRTTCGRRCARHRGIAAQIVQLFHTRFDPRLERRRRTSAREKQTALPPRSRPRSAPSRASTRIASCATSSTRSTSALRTNFYQIDDGGQPKATIAIKFDSRKIDGAAAAAAALRDLRLFAARRGRAPALRQGRARRHPLVGPAAGFPHRGARPGQGAAGEERRDRAGRRQGRLRAEAAAGRRPARGDAGRRHRRLHDVHLEPARHHRQSRARRRHRRPTTSCATTTTIPIWWSRPTRAPRPSPTSPTASRLEHGFWLGDAFASRRLGRLRPQEDGHHGARRLGGGQAAFPRDGRRHQHDAVHGRGRRRHVGRRVRQRHAAARSTIKLVAAFDHRDIFIDPDPDPEASFAERKRLFDAAALELAGLRQGADLGRRRRVSRAAPRRSRSAPRRRRCSASPATRSRRSEVMRAILKLHGRSALVRRHRHLCARLAPRPTIEVGDRANDPIRITGRRVALPRWSARAPISA